MVLKQNKKTMESRFKIREEERRDEDRWEMGGILGSKVELLWRWGIPT